MITLKELLDNDSNNIIEDLYEIYTVQKCDGQEYVNVPFPPKEKFLGTLEYLFNDPYDDVEEFLEELYPYTKTKEMFNEYKDKISRVYDEIEQERKAFYKTFDNNNLVQLRIHERTYRY